MNIASRLRKIVWHSACASFLVILLAAGCGESYREPVSQRQILLGTYVTITSYDVDMDPAAINRAISAGFDAIREVETLTNPYDSASTVGVLNRRSGEAREFLPDRRFYELLSRAMEAAQETGGAFDFTLWPVFRLWGFDTDSAAVPAPERIQEALGKTGYQRVSLDSSRLLLPAGVELDLGGISKGFAVEMARRVLRGQGMRNFIIDAGGNLGIEWNHEEDIQIFVRHPRREGQFWGQFPLGRSCGVSTSGDYQFYFIENGQRYHHILNPQTGYPADDVAAVSIIAPDAITADGLSTAVFVMGRERGREFIESHPELQGLIIYRDGNDSLQTYLSAGVREKFTSLAEESEK
ncbi:MAG: FAD:protein FMN transferase [Calditrichaceae bacterium]|nr:FAD:protein FMN transferase [Calditrichia bacterium]NUQ40115.1 FAD:protein FMN transferase [Calditrichaceae bacterium]